MSALRTLKKFLKEVPVYESYNHSHPEAVLEWFSKKYWGKKEVRIMIDELSSAVIGAEFVEYTRDEIKYIIWEKSNALITRYIGRHLAYYSANYCEYCRDIRRRYWQRNREIIERLPGNVKKFVMDLPLVERRIGYNIVLSDTKLMYNGKSRWLINDEFADIDRVLREFIIEYDKVAAKMTASGPGFSAKCWRFADVSLKFVGP